MALALLIAAIVLIVVGYRGTYAELGQQLATDIPGFLPWLGAIVLIGALGYIPEFSTFSNALMALVILVIILANRGAFANLAQAFQGGCAGQGIPAPTLIPQQDIGPLSQAPEVNVNVSGETANLAAQSSSGAGGIVGGLIGAFGF